MIRHQKETSGEFQKEGERIALADFIMAILLMILCLAVAYSSIKMPSPRGWYTSPGLFPMFIAVGLFGMALALFVGALKEKFSFMVRVAKNLDLLDILTQETTKRVGLITFAVFVYIYILLRFLPFELATFAYLMGTLIIFWKTKMKKILFASLLLPLLISIFFNMFFKTLLPGGSLLWAVLPKIF